jgi:hypothetical protein
MNNDNTVKVTVTTRHKIKTSLLTSSDICLSSLIFCLQLVSSLPEVGSGGTVWRSPPSTVELSHSSLLLCFGGSLPCERKRFCMRCLGIDVTLYAMHCFFSRIHCCGNMIIEPLSMYVCIRDGP